MKNGTDVPPQQAQPTTNAPTTNSTPSWTDFNRDETGFGWSVE